MHLIVESTQETDFGLVEGFDIKPNFQVIDTAIGPFGYQSHDIKGGRFYLKGLRIKSPTGVLLKEYPVVDKFSAKYFNGKFTQMECTFSRPTRIDVSLVKIQVYDWALNKARTFVICDPLDVRRFDLSDMRSFLRREGSKTIEAINYCNHIPIFPGARVKVNNGEVNITCDDETATLKGVGWVMTQDSEDNLLKIDIGTFDRYQKYGEVVGLVPLADGTVELVNTGYTLRRHR